MLIMTNKESRLISAAKRTIRAEATLVIVVLVIVSWSIFGLYKLATGSETIFGFTFSKLSSKQDQVANQSQQDLLRGVNLQEDPTKLNDAGNSNLFPQPQQPPSDAEIKYRNQLIQQLLVGQRELNANLGLSTQVENRRAQMYHNHQQTPYSNRLILAPDNIRYSGGIDSTQTRLPIGDDNLQITNMADSHHHLFNQWPSGEQNQLQNQTVSQASRLSIRPTSRPALNSVQEPSRNNEITSLSNDREAAESSRDPGESFVETGGDEEAPQTISNNNEFNQADSNELTSQDDSASADPETFTAPDSDIGGGANQDDQEDASGQQQQQSSSDQSESGEEPTASGEEAAREESRDIDEEVDRMSAPSLGVAQQQDKPFDYNNTVQFDDTLAPGTGLNKISSSYIEKVKVPPGNVIARFESPTATVDFKSKTKRTRGQRLSPRSGHHQDQSKDLQMDHNSPVSRNELKEKSGMAQQGRQKRSMKPVIRSPYELGAFLDKLNFDPLIGESSNYLELKSPTGTNQSTSLLPGYLTSNDTVLREFLEQKQLFDALKHSQLPAPTTSLNLTPNKTPQHSIATQLELQLDPRTSGSLNHLNRLLEEAANEEHEMKERKNRKQKAYHGSAISKKRKRHEQMKAKKKMAIGLERGGHKKKKQNKEEKKFLKEKRFKGVKKGKKVAKGRGGAGGKKGKKLYKDRGYKKKGFKNVAHKEEWGHKKSYFDEFRDKDFKKKWKKYDDKYNYAQMKKFQAKDEKGAKKLKHHDEKFKKFDNGKWKKSYQKHSKEHQESSNKRNGQKKKSESYD